MKLACALGTAAAICSAAQALGAAQEPPPVSRPVPLREAEPDADGNDWLELTNGEWLQGKNLAISYGATRAQLQTVLTGLCC